MVEYYRLSGKISPVFFGYWLLGLAAVAVMSVIYAIIMFHMPIVYINFLITIGYGILIGMASAFISRQGKLRNAFIWVLNVLVFFAVFTYVHLAAYVAVAFKGDIPVIDMGGFMYVLFSPKELFGELYPIIVSEGVWSISRLKTNVSGIPLLLIWLIEHILVFYYAFHMSRGEVMDTPYFEDTGHWGVKHTCEYAWDYLKKSALGPAREALEHGDASFFEALPPRTQDSACILSYYTDPSEEKEKIYLCVKNIKVIVSKRGNHKQRPSYIVKNLAVTPQFIESLKAAALAINENVATKHNLISLTMR